MMTRPNAPWRRGFLAVLAVLLVFMFSCSEDSTAPEDDLNADIPADGYKSVPPPAAGPLRPALAVEGGVPDNPARIKLTIGGLLGPDGEPIVYDTSKVTIVEDGVVKGYKITLGVNAGLKADIVFVIDNTGSMGPAIAGVRASVLSFLDAIRGSGQDIQAGLIAFNDEIAPGDTTSGVDVTDLRAHPAVYGFHDLTDTYDESSTLYQQIANLPAVAGGDSPELCFGGLDYARRTFGWRSGAQRIYIVITDITSWGQGYPIPNNKGIDADYFTDVSLAELLRSEGSVVHCFCPDNRPFLATGEYNVRPLATLTGGTWTPFSAVLDLTSLPIIGVTTASGLAEYVKNGDPSVVKARTLRVVVKTAAGGTTSDGESVIEATY